MSGKRSGSFLSGGLIRGSKVVYTAHLPAASATRLQDRFHFAEVDLLVVAPTLFREEDLIFTPGQVDFHFTSLFCGRFVLRRW